MDALYDVVVTINSYLSNYVLLVLLVGTGLFFTIRTRAVQFRCFAEGFRRMFGGFSLKGGKQAGGISSFQALATAVAAQVGTGNIVGACGAILLGGPGAIFWMWIIALLGMATNYAEAELAQETEMKGITCFGRASGVNGRVKDCVVETSLDGRTWTERARATLANTADAQDIRFPAPVKARFFRFTALNNHYGDDFASMAEIVVIK